MKRFIILSLISMVSLAAAGQKLFKLFDKGESEEFVAAIKKNPGEISRQNKDGKTILHYIAENETAKSPEYLQLLFNSGATVNLNMLDQSGFSALIYACSSGNLEAVTLLLNHNADPDLRGYGRATAIFYAHAWPAILEILISKGADVNARSSGGRTALMLAAGSKEPESMEILLAAKADPDIRDNDGFSALYFAAGKILSEDHPARENTEGIRVLIKYKADLNLTDHKGISPLMIASRQGFVSSVKILIENGVNVNATDTDGWPAAFYAAYNNYPDVLRILKEAGADLSKSDLEGNTIMYFAKMNKAERAIEYLKSIGIK